MVCTCACQVLSEVLAHYSCSAESTVLVDYTVYNVFYFLSLVAKITARFLLISEPPPPCFYLK